MPVVRRPRVLKAVYDEAYRRIAAREIPSELIHVSQTLYRSFDQEHLRIVKGIFPKQYANQALILRDQERDENRFSGQSFHGDIPSSGGLYCSLQPQALINELQHYARKPKHCPKCGSPTQKAPGEVVYRCVNPGCPGKVFLNGRSIPRSAQTGFPLSNVTLHRQCIVKIRLMSSMLAADLSPHNPYARQFLDEIARSGTVQAAFRYASELQRPMWDELRDGEDCSVARAIGLAVANSGYLRALQAQTVRPSEGAAERISDNLVIFGRNGQQVPGLWIEEAYIFPLSGPLQVIPVQFS